MEEAKPMTQQQQFLLQKQQQQQQQQMLLLQQLQKQAHQQHHQQQAISRFPSNIDAHLRTTPGVIPNRPINIHQIRNSNSNPNPNSTPNLQQQQQQPQQQEQKQIRQLNQAELQMAYQDALRVCHPDFKRPFSSLEDACESREHMHGCFIGCCPTKILHAASGIHDTPKTSSSDELVLQEDGSGESCISAESNRMHIGLADSSVGVGRFNHLSTTSSNLSIQRQNGPVGFSHVEMGSPPSANDLHAGYRRLLSKRSHFMPHTTQNSPSRLRQQNVQRFNHGRSTGPHGSEWNHMKIQLPPSNLNAGGPHSPGNSTFRNGIPWGPAIRSQIFHQVLVEEMAMEGLPNIRINLTFYGVGLCTDCLTRNMYSNSSLN